MAEQIPVGYFAVALHDYENDEIPLLGHQVIHRKKRAGLSRTVTTYAVDDANWDAIRRDALTFDELVYLVAKDPTWYQEEFGRFFGRCGVCNRTLSDPDSKALGIGPECRKGLVGARRG